MYKQSITIFDLLKNVNKYFLNNFSLIGKLLCVCVFFSGKHTINIVL